MIKNIIVACVAIVLTCGVAFATLHTEKVEAPSTSLGAVSSPDIPSPYVSWGGVRNWAGHTDVLANASTTCSIQSPAATSTLDYASISFVTASTSALQIEFGSDTTGFATTTRIGNLLTLAASSQGTFVASTTNAANSPLIFAPNTYMNVKIGGGGVGTTAVGNCQAAWIQD